MASRIIVDCDLHAQAGEQVEGETIPPFTLWSERMVTLDLCGDCQGMITFKAQQDLGDLVGVEYIPPAMRRAPTQGGGVRAHQPLEDRTCRFCQRTFNSTQGRKQHETHIHREERVKLGELDADPSSDQERDPDLKWVDPEEEEPVGQIVHDETGDHEEPLVQPNTSNIGSPHSNWTSVNDISVDLFSEMVQMVLGVPAEEMDWVEPWKTAADMDITPEELNTVFEEMEDWRLNAENLVNKLVAVHERRTKTRKRAAKKTASA